MPRVLIVDDDPAIRAVLAEVIRDAGSHVETTCNGIQALERVRGTRSKQQVHWPCSKNQSTSLRYSNSSDGTSQVLQRSECGFSHVGPRHGRVTRRHQDLMQPATLGAA